MGGAGQTFKFFLMNSGKAIEVFKKGSTVPDCFKNDYFPKMGKTGRGRTLGNEGPKFGFGHV